MPAKEANPREPAGPLQPVEKIVLPLLAHREVLADGEVAREPVDGALEIGTGGSLAAVVNQRSLEILGALKPLGTGDDQTGDPRAGHARGRDRVAEVVPPAAIPALGLLPVVPGQRPDFGLDRYPGLAGRIEAEQGVLGIGVVTALRDFRVSPAPGGPSLAGLDLGRFEPAHVGGHPELIAFRLGGREHHGLQRNRIGAPQVLGAEAAKMTQGLANGRRIGFLARGQEGQCDQAGRSRFGLGTGVLPGPVGLLLLLEVTEAVADGSLDVFPRHGAVRRDAGSQDHEQTRDRDGRSSQGSGETEHDGNLSD